MPCGLADAVVWLAITDLASSRACTAVLAARGVALQLAIFLFVLLATFARGQSPMQVDLVHDPAKQNQQGG